MRKTILPLEDFLCSHQNLAKILTEGEQNSKTRSKLLVQYGSNSNVIKVVWIHY